MNCYDILGVPKNASQQDIQKAYRDKVKTYHPDRAVGDKQASEHFKQVQEAYEIIGNKEKRAEYDNPQQNINMVGDFNDFINSVFNGRSSRQERHVEINNQFEIAIDFWEAVQGCDKTLTVPKFKTCETCLGSGAAEVETCSLCVGKGVITQRQGFVTMQTTCPQCRGSGHKIKKNCEACKGSGSIKNNGMVKVQIPEGICNGMLLKISGEGHEHLGQIGDLYLVVRVNGHEIFKRHDDNNLIVELPITYSQAVLGTTIKVPTLDGEVDLAIPANTKNQATFVIPGKGFRNINYRPDSYTHQYGDLIVVVQIETIGVEAGEVYKRLVEELAKWDKENESPMMKRFRKMSKR